MKFISGLIRHLYASNSQIYLTTIEEISQEYHKKENVTGKNWEDKDNL